MYIRNQSGDELINFDNWLGIEISGDTIVAFRDDKKIVLGRYEDPERLEREYNDLMESLLDPDVGIHEVE